MKVNKDKNYTICVDRDMFFVKGTNLIVQDGLVTMLTSKSHHRAYTDFYARLYKSIECYAVEKEITIPYAKIDTIRPYKEGYVTRWTTRSSKKAENIIKRYEEFCLNMPFCLCIRQWWRRHKPLKNRKDKNAQNVHNDKT